MTALKRALQVLELVFWWPSVSLRPEKVGLFQKMKLNFSFDENDPPEFLLSIQISSFEKIWASEEKKNQFDSYKKTHLSDKTLKRTLDLFLKEKKLGKLFFILLSFFLLLSLAAKISRWKKNVGLCSFPNELFFSLCKKNENTTNKKIQNFRQKMSGTILLITDNAT